MKPTAPTLQIYHTIYSDMYKGKQVTSDEIPELQGALGYFRTRKIKFSSVKNGGRSNTKTYFMSEVDRAINNERFGGVLTGK